MLFSFICSTEKKKVTHLTNFTFDGVKADLSKSVSMDPAFQVQHSFSLAKATEPPSYNFGAVFAKKDVRLSIPFFSFVLGLIEN